MSRARTILMVDDVPMFRDLVGVFLARTARVLQASCGAEALDIVRTQEVDLVVTDLHMPDLDGAALCSAIKADPELAHLPVLILLRSGNTEDSVRAVRAGADDMIAKPIGRGALIHAVNHFLESGLHRGLPRVELTAPVQMSTDLFAAWGTARNISRGGINIESDCELEPKSEISLDLVLPESDEKISPTAEIVWARESLDHRTMEMGMRFLSIDGLTMRALDDFISLHMATDRGYA